MSRYVSPAQIVEGQKLLAEMHQKIKSPHTRKSLVFQLQCLQPYLEQALKNDTAQLSQMNADDTVQEDVPRKSNGHKKGRPKSNLERIVDVARYLVTEVPAEPPQGSKLGYVSNQVNGWVSLCDKYARSIRLLEDAREAKLPHLNQFEQYRDWMKNQLSAVLDANIKAPGIRKLIDNVSAKNSEMDDLYQSSVERNPVGTPFRTGGKVSMGFGNFRSARESRGI